ncbi:MAG: SDR family NAD(P)-dependent oxidoreductase, partial [Acidimicrobiia bacterium]
MALDLELDGRSAIITGASAGLGLAATATLLDNGGRVVMVARGAERLNAAREELAALYGEDNVIAAIADVTDPGDVERLVATATSAFGGVDILVNNAGEAKACPFVEQSDATWSYDI